MITGDNGQSTTRKNIATRNTEIMAAHVFLILTSRVYATYDRGVHLPTEGTRGSARIQEQAVVAQVILSVNSLNSPWAPE